MTRGSTPNHIGAENANLLVGTSRSFEQRAAGGTPRPGLVEAGLLGELAPGVFAPDEGAG